MRAAQQTYRILTSILGSEGGISLLIGLPATIYFFASSAVQPF